MKSYEILRNPMKFYEIRGGHFNAKLGNWMLQRLGNPLFVVGLLRELQISCCDAYTANLALWQIFGFPTHCSEQQLTNSTSAKKKPEVFFQTRNQRRHKMFHTGFATKPF